VVRPRSRVRRMPHAGTSSPANTITTVALHITSPNLRLPLLKSYTKSTSHPHTYDQPFRLGHIVMFCSL